MQYMEYDKNRTITGENGINAETIGQDTTISVNTIDEGYY